MKDLDKFISDIYNFTDLSVSIQLDCFVYYLTKVQKFDGVSPKEIKDCFDSLNIPAYSNIPLYLKENAKRKKKKIQKFLLKNKRYFLTPQSIVEIELNYLGKPNVPKASNKLISLDLFQGVRGYVSKIAVQAATCYDLHLFDACAVMLRRLLETLIIEAFERKGIESKIKNSDGNFFYLSDLIDIYEKEPNFNVSRNTKISLKKLKGLGDLSAHNRRYLAKKGDIDDKKDELRVTIEELLHIIDYPNWKN